MSDEIVFGGVYEPSAVLDPRSAWLVVSSPAIHTYSSKVVVAFVDQGKLLEPDLISEPIAGCGTADLFELLTVRKAALGRRIGALHPGQRDSVTTKIRQLFGP